MSKYRKKPVVIEAFQWKGAGYLLGADARELYDQSGVTLNHIPLGDPRKCEQCGAPLSAHANCPTLEGHHIVCPDDYIIKGVKGEFYPCKPDIFKLTYEEIDE